VNQFTREDLLEVVAFISSLIILGLLVGVVFWIGKRRAPGAPLSWGEALAASTGVFFGMFWAYGVVPHAWLLWADNELGWRPDVSVGTYFPALSFLEPQANGGNLPLTITMLTLRDLIVVLLHVAFLGFQIYLWAWWQKRGTQPSKEIATSDYGRPLVKAGAGTGS
jgi:hypothetical protein